MSEVYISALNDIRHFENLGLLAMESVGLMSAVISESFKESLSLSLPVIESILITEELFKSIWIPSLGDIAESVRISNELQNSILRENALKVQELFSGFKTQIENLSPALLPHIEAMSDLENFIVPPGELVPIVDSARLDIERIDRALDVILIEMSDTISNLELELDKKEKEIKRLKEIIKDYRDRKKYFYVT